MTDNTVLSDVDSNRYTLRSKDVSAAGDGSLRRSLVLSTAYPLDYGSGGCFHHTVRSGVMAAGLTANAPILAFLNPSATMLAAIRRAKLTAWSLGTGFAAGMTAFEMYVARTFTTLDSGGVATSLTTPQTKLRTSMGASVCSIQHSSTATLTAGTRTLDTGPVEAINVTTPTTTFTNLVAPPGNVLFNKAQGEHPLLLAQNEGFVIQASVPSVGTWSWAITLEWDEVPLAQF
jgi:hypothetical protein